ncbi:MAG: sugar MFS transporter [Lachnotalea sp.]
MINYNKAKYGCYLSSMSQAAVANITPILFIPLREIYGISYTLLGSLVLINFITQLIIDILFTLYSSKFNIELTVKCTPIITVIGMFLFAMSPVLFPGSVYFGLVLGTVISSSSSGLIEVLVSPVVAAIPSENPDREMSILHSVYAWGVVVVVIISTIFLKILGNDKWQWLLAIWALIPFASIVLFMNADIPLMSSNEKENNVFNLLKKPYFILCLLCIFFGGAAECTMAQWSSGYLEKAMVIDKMWGDIFGVAMFGMTLGIGRTLYAKYGKNIYKVLFLGAIFATVSYLTITITNIPIISLIACAGTGFCVSMMWPGSLIAASDRFKSGGVMMFALLAAAGDLGASVGPWFVGRVTDVSMQSDYIVNLATKWNMNVEQVGLKLGIFLATIFPLMAVLTFGILLYFNKDKVKDKSW